jgi:hypothetical protein
MVVGVEEVMVYHLLHQQVILEDQVEDLQEILDQPEEQEIHHQQVHHKEMMEE